MIIGFKRSLRHQNTSKIRVQIQKHTYPKNLNVIGKKVFLLEKNQNFKKKKVIWGKIITKHGNRGVYIAKFRKQICPSVIPSVVFISHFPVN